MSNPMGSGGGGGFGAPPGGGGGFGTPPGGGGGFGTPPGGGGGFGTPPGGGGGFGTPPGGGPNPPPGGGGFGAPPGGGGTPPPGGGGFGVPPGGGGGFGPPGGAAPVAVNHAPALILSIVTIVICGCLPGGIIGLLFASQAKQAADRGNAEEAKKKLMISYVVSGGSVALMGVGFFLYFALVVVASL